MTENISTISIIEALMDYAVGHDLLDVRDCRWARNRLLALAGCDGCSDAGHSVSPATELPALLESLTANAAASGMVGDEPGAEERFQCDCMDVLMPRPSQVKERFDALLTQDGPRAACDYLYGLSCDCGYVHREAMRRDIKWALDSKWGMLEITINCSKPEKDPRAIANARLQDEALRSSRRYPACQLCLENEGYCGRSALDEHGEHPARQNLRIADIRLGDERWALQYSPYAYYEQHCIVINRQHVPMHIDVVTFRRLLDFVERFPQYFIGSNADLPIVGGSILNHDHFQAGMHRFPMDDAPLSQEFCMESFPSVACGVVKWPVSVIRLRCADAGQLLKAADHVLQRWRAYSDCSAGVLASDEDGTPHNTITPIARIEQGEYVMDLALRCNIANDEHPLGVFHPHEELHHIKRENIGLIEVMGLAILPGRLSGELDAVADALVGGAARESLEASELTARHADWVMGIAARHPELSSGNVRSIIRREVTDVFSQVLECAGVFKWDAAGRAAMQRFIDCL